MEFNARVLAEAENAVVPLLERVKFLSIFASNLDEFFMVRVAALWRMVQEQIPVVDSPDDLTSSQTLTLIKKRVEELQMRVLSITEVLLNELRTANIHIISPSELSEGQTRMLANYFSEQVAPVLTPLSVDPGHPFPYLSNLRLYMVAVFDIGKEGLHSDEPIYSLVEIPSILPRLISVEDTNGAMKFILLEDVIRMFLDQVVVGFAVKDIFMIRATRNFDYRLLENEVVDLLSSVHSQVTKKWEQEVIRLEVSQNIPEDLLMVFRHALEVADEDIYRISGPMDLASLGPAFRNIDRPMLKDPAFNPRVPARLADNSDIFQVISEGELMVHHPYDSFYAVTRFLYAAATDPDVLAIKQTLYRTSGDSPIIDALLTAAENGKQVVAVIELKARFDEKANIVWARRLERAGVNVVYGFVGYKTHAKAALVVRREKGRLVRYAHLSTGNYNSSTARIYTDIGMFTCDKEITADVGNLFNFLTGYNILVGEKRLVQSRFPTTFQSLALSPFGNRQACMALVDQEIAFQKQGRGGHIIAKMNALVDKQMIDKLYEASRAGVKIDLIVRGMCCLVPGEPMLSENIRVVSVIDRFLEHSRIFYCQAGGEHRVYLASSDWMPRNFDRRIEIMWPVKSETIRMVILNDILRTYLADNQKSWALQASGHYVRVPMTSEVPVRSQQDFIETAREEGVKSIPYETAIRQKKNTDSPVAKERTTRKRAARPKVPNSNSGSSNSNQ